MSQQKREIYEFSNFRLDIGKGILLCEGHTVSMQLKTFELLCILVKSNGQLITRDELMNQLWADTFVEENNLSQHIHSLRKVLEENGSGTAFIETVPRRGYRFIAPVKKNIVEDDNEDSAVKDNLKTEITEEPSEKSRVSNGKLQKRFIIAAGLLVLFFLGGYLLYSRLPLRTEERQYRLAILPFTNLHPDEESDFLGFALADALIAKLGPIKSLGVLPTSSVFKYRNHTPSPQEAAKELSADLLLTGSYLKNGDRLKVNAQLVNIPQNKIIYQDDFEIDYRNLSDSQEYISRRLIYALGLSLSDSESMLLQKQKPRSEKAYELYLRGIDYYAAARLPLAIETLEESVSLDPNFSRAWSYLGTAYMINASTHFGGREQYDKAQSAFEKATALDPDDPRPQILLANILIDTNRVEKAVPILQKIIGEQPEVALAYWNLSYAYRFGGLLEKAMQTGEQAHRIDPGFVLRTDTPIYYLYLRQYENYKANLSPYENTAYITFYRGFANYHLQNLEAAKKDFDEAYAMDSHLLQAQVGKALSLALENKSEEGLKILREAEKRIDQQEVYDAEGIYKIAQAYSVLDDKKSALRVFRKSVAGGFFCYPYFQIDPLLSNIRNEPEFEEIMKSAEQRYKSFVENFS